MTRKRADRQQQREEAERYPHDKESQDLNEARRARKKLVKEAEAARAEGKDARTRKKPVDVACRGQ